MASFTSKLSLDKQQRFHLECVDAQADLNLRWAYKQTCRKCCAAAHVCQDPIFFDTAQTVNFWVINVPSLVNRANFHLDTDRGPERFRFH